MKHALGALAFILFLSLSHDAAAYYNPSPLPDAPGEYDCGGSDG